MTFETGETAETKARKKEALVRVGYFVNLPPLLESFDCDPKTIIQDSGLRLKSFENPKSQITYLGAGRLLARCVEATGCKHFGLLLGQRFEMAYAGAAGFAAMSSDTVEGALKTIIEFLVLSDEGGSLMMTPVGKFTKLGYQIHEEDVLAPEQIHDMTLAATFKGMKGLCGTDWQASEIWLTRKDIKDSRPYRQYFKAPISYNRPESAILFHSDCLKRPLPTANKALHDFLSSLVNEAKRHLRPDLVRVLSAQISLGLLDDEISLQAISRRIGAHPRTLNRRLKQAGTSFQELRENVRKSTASKLLQQTEIPIMEIAALLGYSDSSSFNHAFRRWFGISPTTWRKQ